MTKAMYEVEWISNQGGHVSILTSEVEAEDESAASEEAYDDYYFMELRSVRHMYDIEEETNASQ